jgi:hypothetical protein
MSPPRKRAAAAAAPLIQDRPAEPAQVFAPNPVVGVRRGRPEPYDRYLKVVGPKEVGGVRAPGWVVMSLTDGQLEALIAGGHVTDYPAGAGWGDEDAPDAQTEAVAPSKDAETDPEDKPKAGTDKEGN